MNDIDDKIKQAFNRELNDIIADNERTDANPFKQIKWAFKSKMKWIYAQVMFYTIAFFAVMVYAIYRFYHEQDLKSLIGWGIVIIMTGLIGQIGKLWYWSELGRNRVIREVKLLELQLAHLIQSNDNKQ
ncbi:DUF6768 family protein [Marinicella sp. W31]|uniref:DUF6768 family protein n=1 Tax=Marinicella sp. W31 TaxID=3023713 RepID=UPI00375668E8